MDDCPVSKIKLLKLRTKGKTPVEIDDIIDQDPQDRSSNKYGSAGLVSIDKITSSALLPTISFSCMMQYSAQEHDKMVEMTINFAESLQILTNEIQEEQGNVDNKMVPSSLEIEQREQLDELSVWRKSLMNYHNDVLPPEEIPENFVLGVAQKVHDPAAHALFLAHAQTIE